MQPLFDNGDSKNSNKLIAAGSHDKQICLYDPRAIDYCFNFVSPLYHGIPIQVSVFNDLAFMA